jgi:SnoaL-like polyketide cyclase
VECAGLGGDQEEAFVGHGGALARATGTTLGRDAHQAESEAFFKSIENHLDNNPYKVMFASGDWTCTIAKWTGKMIGPWQGLDGKVHPATGKTFALEFCTVARWKNGGDRRGKPVLRPSWLSKANRRVVNRALDRM